MAAPNPNNLILLDGGIGHELKRRGISDGTFLAGALANEDTNGDGAGVVESIHYDFLSAGCDVITTNSFVAVPSRMIECGLASNEAGANARAAELIAASVDRAKAAIAKYSGDESTPKRIAGCVPPLSECYFADKVPQSSELVPGYITILSTLIDCGVDLLLAETLSTLREADAILKALSCIQRQDNNRQSPPLWISFTIHDDEPTQLRSRELLIDTCQSILNQAKLMNVYVEAMGVNCSTPPAITAALDMIKEEFDRFGVKLICYGNCFQTTTSEWIQSLNNEKEQNSSVETTKQSCIKEYDADGYLLPEAYARYAEAWVEKGAAIIGGCCGCSPAHIKAVTSTLRYSEFTNNK